MGAHTIVIASVSQDLWIFLGLFGAYVVAGIAPVLAVIYLIYHILTLPMRRNERVRLLLDILENGIRQGHSPEQAVADAASSNDKIFAGPFANVANSVRQGLRLSQALHLSPRLAPLPIRAMLETGERLGDISKVLPACRLLLRDGVSQVRGALNYLLVFSVVGLPFGILIPIILKVKILPAYRQVFAGMAEGSELPALTRFVMAQDSTMIAAQVVICLFVWAVILAYIAGPRIRDFIENLGWGEARWLDRVTFLLPWRRKRLQRNFSAMLATLLESGMPEVDSVRSAAESTANRVIRNRAAIVARKLQAGVSLPEALSLMDEKGELSWRVANALHGGRNFSSALIGWHEALDAKAFQLEQAAAQVTTTVVVLINGALVAAFVIAMFLPLINLLNRITLW